MVVALLALVALQGLTGLIVTKLDGSARLKSAAERGAAFVVRLPLMEAA